MKKEKLGDRKEQTQLNWVCLDHACYPFWEPNESTLRVLTVTTLLSTSDSETPKEFSDLGVYMLWQISNVRL